MGESRHELGRRFFAHQDRVKSGPAAEMCTGDYLAWFGANGPMDRAVHVGWADGFYEGFPDMRHEVTDVIVEGDKLAVRLMMQGTHTGMLFGIIRPTDKHVTVWANVLMHLEGDRVKRLYGMLDEAGLLRQLGVIPG